MREEYVAQIDETVLKVQKEANGKKKKVKNKKGMNKQKNEQHEKV